MARTVVYDDVHVRHEMDALMAADPPSRVFAPSHRRRLRREAEHNVALREVDDRGAGSDDYVARIAKYVPVETISLTLLGYAAYEPSGAVVWAWLAGGALVNVVYLWSVAAAGPDTARPRAFFYVLSVVAYVLWACATIEPAEVLLGVVGTDAPARRAFVLAAAAFVVPGLDVVLTHVTAVRGKVPETKTESPESAPPAPADREPAALRIHGS